MENKYSWFKEANRLFDAGLYQLALNSYEKAGVTPEEEIKLNICKIMLDKKQAADVVNASYLKEQKFYREAGIIYNNASKPLLAKLMSLYGGVSISDSDAWEIIYKERLTDEDMEIINKSGFLTKKSEEILTRMDKLQASLKGE